MSNNKKLLVYRDSKLIKEVLLSGDSFTIGRDDSCNLKLESESISRNHAKILIQEESIYIENQSSTGQLFLNQNQVEFAEWPKESSINLGPFLLKWSEGEIEANSNPVPASSDTEVIPEESPKPASDSFEFSDNWSQNEGQNGDSEQSDQPEDASDETQGEDLKFEMPEPSIQIDSLDSQDNHELVPHVDESESTKIADTSAIGVLKIVQGEISGREIKLDQGFQWIVGRSGKCHIKIDNGKLSRQHFKIVKISGRYRIQDLGSANGTRLNGVAITDAPLSPFDTVVAGPVEFQFLMTQSGISQANIVSAASPGNFSSQESTQFAAPPMVYSGEGAGNPFEHVGQQHFDQAPNQNTTDNSRNNGVNGKASVKVGSKVSIWWNELPKNKRLTYIAAAALIFAVLLVPSEEPANEDLAQPQNVTQTQSQATPAQEQASNTEVKSSDISPEFYLLNADDRRKVEDAYAKAERARNASDWKSAVEHSKEVLKFVDKYKDTADILAESQTHFNDVILGAVTKNLKNSLDAESQVQDQVNLLIDAGKKAISEARWADAQDQCAKAVSLDPKNEEANKCYAAAYGQDANYTAEAAPEATLSPVDPNNEIQAQIEREFEIKKQAYQEAQNLEQNGNLDKALEGYSSLLTQVTKEIETANIPGRYPASLSSSVSQKHTELKVQIDQRIKDIYFQYETEYRTQLIDAEQLIANQDYIRARETYDRILNSAPNYQDVRQKRAELYNRMISEAKGIYHEALIYESVGDLQAAIDKFSQTKKMLAGIAHPAADEYYRKSSLKLRTLMP